MTIGRAGKGGIAMATIASVAPVEGRHPDKLTGTPRAHALDRWIFVLMAVWYIAIVLAGFIPDSIMKVAMVKAGVRPPFPLVLHMHAVLMGSFMLFLLWQTILVATGRTALHRRIGPIGGLLAAALVVVGFILAPTMYHQVYGGLSVAPPEAQGQIRDLLSWLDNILMLQIAAGILFASYIGLALAHRASDSGFHKRMMIMAPAMALGAAFSRITWLPHTIPASPLSILAYQWLAIAPLFVWDVISNRRIHSAYWVLLATYLPANLLVLWAWDKPWWHETAHRIMGV